MVVVGRGPVRIAVSGIVVGFVECVIDAGGERGSMLFGKKVVGGGHVEMKLMV